MEHQGSDVLALSEALQAKGWHLEDDILYSPNGGVIQLGGGNVDVARHMVKRMHERTKDFLDKFKESPPSHFNSTQYKNHIEDMESVLTTLKEFLDGKVDI